ncbi:ectonucleoside triphosphate diphosphohydrolase 1-like isoform X2 [Lineus longissimus]|uniref:ectonucleoside triphosphate diphosphohydrolase 1-like isoform X2 n=1 Tax=Lineus longissimus TaxID=88925 RepID=UPI00315C7F6E
MVDQKIKTPSESTFGFNNFWLLAGVSLLIGTIGIVAISVIKVTGDAILQEYGIVIDCGSTHTEIFVYSWPGTKLNGTGVIKQVSSCRREIPLASFETHPKDAGPSLVDCIHQAAVSHIPQNSHHETRIYLGATAGMRMLYEKDSKASDAIMQSVRKTLKEFPFKFSDPADQARIISGREEGSFSWVTSNYLSGIFAVSDSGKVVPRADADTPSRTFGALDLGGASTQITYQPAPSLMADIPAEYVEPLLLYGEMYETFADTFLCFGKTEVERRLLANLVNADAEAANNSTVTNPCAPRGSLVEKAYGYVFEAPCTVGKQARLSGTEVIPHKDIPKNSTFRFRGTGNSSQCQLDVDKLFNFTNCPYEGHCSFQGHYIPDVYGKYLAFTGFFHVMDFLNLTAARNPGVVTLKKFTSVVDGLCAKDWKEVKTMRSPVTDLLPFYCFDGHYVLTLLTKGYGFNETNWKSIEFVDKIQDTTVGWPVGYMLNVTNSIPIAEPLEKISFPVFIGLMCVFIFFIFVAIGFACHAKSSRESKSEYQKLPEYGTV